MGGHTAAQAMPENYRALKEIMAKITVLWVICGQRSGRELDIIFNFVKK